MDVQPRLASLDALRGFAIASMVLVNNPGDWSHLYAPLDHATWNGWTFTDLVFPLFLFAAGMAMTISLGRRSRQGVAPLALLWGTLRRAGVIFVVGLALNFIPGFDIATVRIPGVLQRIALCIAIATPVVIWGGWRAAIIAIAALLAAYSVLMLLVPFPGPYGVAAIGQLEPGRDFGAWVDRNVFGAHLWAQSRTWDPEGLVSTLPAAASLLFGVLAGEWLRRGKAPGDRVGSIVLAGAVMLALGLAMNAVFMPINKNLWTPSYTVFMTGWSLVLLAIFHALLDDSPPAIRRRTRAACLPLTILGMNALFIFAFSGLVARLLVSIHVDDLSLKALLYDPIRALPLAPEDASLFYAIAFELAMFVVAWFMWKKRWFVKA